MPLTQQPVYRLAAQLRRHEITPTELVDAHITRIEAINPTINALANRRFDLARLEAQHATEQLAHTRPDELPPLFGIPCTVKEFFKVEGLPWTGAVRNYAGRRATEDSTVVRRLKNAGAIVLGATNAPEGGLWMETYNHIYGRTSNPWNPRHTCGGSSGGEGALVGAGGSAFGVGSDVGGSIRIPAAFCGVYGHKPSGRRVPSTGHYPDGTGDTTPFMGFGPLARSARDLITITNVLSGPDGHDRYCREMSSIHPESHQDLRGLRVIPLPQNGRTRIAPYMQSEVNRAAKLLADRGATIEERTFPRMKRGMEMWSAMLSEHSEHDYEHLLTEGQGISWLREMARLPSGKSAHTFAALILVGLDRLLNRLPISQQPFLDDARLLQEELEVAMGSDGILLHPGYSRVAPRHRGPWFTPFDFVCTAVFNILEFPATVVPMTQHLGLPVSIQVVGPRQGDARTLRAAMALEDALGAWKRAPVLA